MRLWKEVIDPNSKSVYYWNVATGETTWENPDGKDTENVDISVSSCSVGTSPPYHAQFSGNLIPPASSGFTLEGGYRCPEDSNGISISAEDVKRGNDPFVGIKSSTQWEGQTPSIKDRIATIINQIDKKESRLTSFFKELKIIHDVCEEYSKATMQEIEQLLLKSLDNLNSILNIATPNTKIYEKYTKYKNILQSYSKLFSTSTALSDLIIEEIINYSDEIEQALDNIRGITVTKSSHEIYNEYKIYIKKKKQDDTKNKWLEFIKVKRNVDKVENTKDRKEQEIKVKKKRINKLHQKWSRAAEIIDGASDADRDKCHENFNPSFYGDTDNVNLIPITTPWWRKQSQEN